MINDIFEYTFLKNAFLCAILASVTCGIIGTIIVEKKLVMMSGGIAHASFGGIGFGYWIGIEPILGGLIFALLSALGIVNIKRMTENQSDLIIGMFWSVGMALGVLFISFTPGYPPDMSTYLFGDILTVSKVDIYLITLLGIFICLVISSFFNHWKAFLFDEEFLKVIGIKTINLESFIFLLIALAIVVLIKVVGIILVITLLTVPPMISKIYTYDLKKIMISSSLISMLLSVLGLTLSYYMNIPSGATIILLSATSYMIAVMFN